MKISFTVGCLGYSVGGYNNSFEIEIKDSEVEGMTDEEKRGIYRKMYL